VSGEFCDARCRVARYKTPVTANVSQPVENTVEEVSAGVWVLRFPTKEHMVGSRCQHLLPPLTAASKLGPLVLMALPPDNLRLIDPGLPAFWLDAVTTKKVAISAACIITNSAAVRTVMNGFAMAMKLMSKSIQMATPATLDEAIRWGRSVATPRVRT
jgi:hypothetical protein